MLLYAHRGDNRFHPENTRAAFDSSISRGFRAVELDLVTLQDDQVVIFHDDDLRRLAGRDLQVRDLDLPAFRAAFPALMTFAEFYERYAPQNIHANFEVKDTPRTLDRMLAGGLENYPSYVISSFEHAVVEHALDLGLPAAYLVEDLPRLRSTWPGFRTTRVHVEAGMCAPIAADPQFARAELYVWTVNDLEQGRALARLPQVRGLFTDNPELLQLAD